MTPHLRLGLLTAAALALLALPAAAQASHIMGGSMELRVVDNRLQGTVSYSERDNCTVGDDAFDLGVTFTDPSGNQGGFDVPTTYVRCIPDQATQSGSFDLDIASDITPDPLPLVVEDGVYRAEFSSCCRVSPIENGDPFDDSTSFAAQVTRNGATPSSSPGFGSLPVTGIAKGFEYRQNVNAFDVDTPLAYLTQAGQPAGPAFDVVTYESNGDVVIPAATTATFNNGEFYVYKVRVTDALGNYSERDVLLLVTDQNTPPFFQGLPASVDVAAGGNAVVDFTAADNEGAQTVSVSTGPLPPWASISTTPGNPAIAQLTLSPPAAAAGTSETISLDAFDDFPDVPLSASAALRVNVLGDEPTSPPAPASEKTCFFGRQVTIEGTDSADRIAGTPGPDVIFTGGGDDEILGGAGDDLICAGAGADTIKAGPGDDRVKGSAGDDRIRGENGNDWLRGGPGDDRISGGPGRDRLMGNDGDDSLFGGPGADELLGGPGEDRARGRSDDVRGVD